jgi:hypothetical protein
LQIEPIRAKLPEAVGSNIRNLNDDSAILVQRIFQ